MSRRSAVDRQPSAVATDDLEVRVGLGAGIDDQLGKAPTRVAARVDRGEVRTVAEERPAAGSNGNLANRAVRHDGIRRACRRRPDVCSEADQRGPDRSPHECETCEAGRTVLSTRRPHPAGAYPPHEPSCKAYLTTMPKPEQTAVGRLRPTRELRRYRVLGSGSSAIARSRSRSVVTTCTPSCDARSRIELLTRPE